jgi:hypothetical protein
MTREQKLAVHLEMIIWQDLPEGTQLNAGQITELMIGASNDQRRRAYERALTHSPRLLEDEQTETDRVGQERT